MNVASFLTEAADETPSKTALFYPDRPGSRARAPYRAMSFRELDEESDRIAHGLKRIGIGRGCRVLLMVPPGVEFLALTFAVLKTGAVLVLIDPGMGKSNLLHCIREVAPEALAAVPLAHALRKLYPGAFRSVKQAVTVGRRWFWGGATLKSLRAGERGRFTAEPARGGDLAAIFFTTGSTGIPKGVPYLHGMIAAQVRSIREAFQIGKEEVGLPAFAPFALLCIAMGTTCVLPDMDPTKPAEVDPENILGPIREYGVSYSFGSPAFWNRVSPYCVERALRLPSLKKVLLAGAPVPGELLERLKRILPADGESHTPYGATEALPVTSISGSEVLAETLSRSKQGGGICVGRALPGIELKIIKISDEPIPSWDQRLVLPENEIGEIVVRGSVVTREYFRRDDQTALAKIHEGESIWHRMGDVGYLDEKGRLWFCGRKNHRVVTAHQTMYTIPCEAIFNQHPKVFRSALVGVGPRSQQRPVIVVEPKPGTMPDGAEAAERFARELLELGSRSELTSEIRDVLFHERFPVDFRHNAKIIREQLALWAEEKLRRSIHSLRRGKSSP